jgi:5-methylcytosine-specific restriction enzyme A
MDHLIISADPDDVDRERRKAKELKKSSWWKNRLGEGKCSYCEERHHPKNLTMDHMTPLIRGGKTSKSNCVPACPKCNKLKENLPAEEWRTFLEKRQE